MQCYYCYKHGYKATKYKLQEQAKKIRKENCKKGSKNNASANAAIAATIAETTNKANIADAKIWACCTSTLIVKNQD